jgi:hypothetical protein
MPTKKLKDLSKEKLKTLRSNKTSSILEANILIDRIDREIIRRKPFKSLADVARENVDRSLDKNKCIFWDCDEKPAYTSVVSIVDERFTIRVCGKHANCLHEPRHNVVASMYVVKDE